MTSITFAGCSRHVLIAALSWTRTATGHIMSLPKRGTVNRQQALSAGRRAGGGGRRGGRGTQRM